MRFKVVNYSRLEIRLDTLHIYKDKGRFVIIACSTQVYTCIGLLTDPVMFHAYQPYHQPSKLVLS